MDDSRFPFLDGVAGVLVDGGGRILDCTAAAEALLALPAGVLRGRLVRELLAGRLEPAGALDGVKLGEPEGAWAGRVQVRTGDGRLLDLEVRLLALRGAAGGDRTAARYVVLGAPAATADRWRQDQAFTRELFLQDRFGLVVFDRDLRIVRTNTHLLPYSGMPVALSGRRLADFLQPQDAAAVEQHLRQVMETGRPLVLAEELARTVIDPRGGRMMAISAFRLQGADGEVIGLTALFNDITEEYRTRRRLALLHQVTAAIGRSLSVTDSAKQLAEALTGTFADVASVEIAAAVFSGEEPAPDPNGRLLLRRTAVAGPPESLPAPGDTVLVGPDGETVLVGPDGREEVGVLGALAEPWRLTAPLSARGVLLGRISVRRDRWKEAYEEEDHALLKEAAARAGLALDNARRYTREHRAAIGLQRSLLPPAVRSVAAVSTASVYLPTDTVGGVGGDWFDVIPLSSARVALVVGDVTGHGLHASATMGRLRTAVRTLADLDLEPEELLVHLDDLVAQLLVEAALAADDEDDLEADGLHPTRYGVVAEPAVEQSGSARSRPEAASFGGTCLYAVYDPVSRTCTVASAGHPPPAVAHPDGSTEFLPVVPGPPLGVGGLPFESVKVELEPGSVLALYTDGLIERGEGDIDAGMAELTRRLAVVLAQDLPLPETGQRIIAGLPPTRLQDDVTLLLARTKAVAAADTAVWSVEPEPAAVAKVREDATSTLEDWGLAELAFTTELVLSELVTNAIRYAGGPVVVRLIRADTLTCEVSDGSSTQPRMRRARLTDEGGRGLYLVAQLTNRWGSRYTASGKTIWTEQELPGG
ncbi:SpoIIE family protein phosphatase [Kitasatospora sp. GAS204B]|uniref:SpoIIE family protein phosphatase n=1 Tax=unclassified Kitasatospora TaxID=2633591 RepID=UPI0024748190|nr:SpoIIE family protein phosphatase [Kitasatospora sp. GAS204B]MDH6119060.1 serine phosphatase RsbU (regulator of sigma subunit)/PAS domain-containing protein [Kitasatospora sp. GAS204B]